MRTKVLAILAISVLLCSVVLISGCGAITNKIAEKTTEKAIENATGNKVDIKGDTVNIEGENGATASLGEGAEIPKDFPSDVPVYEGTVKGAISGDGTWTVSIETPDDPQTVLDWYAKELESNGWTKDSTVSTADGGMYSAKNGDRVVTVVASSGGDTAGSTTVSLSVSSGQ